MDVLVCWFEFQVKAAHLRSVASFFRKIILIFVFTGEAISVFFASLLHVAAVTYVYFVTKADNKWKKYCLLDICNTIPSYSVGQGGTFLISGQINLT